MKCPQEKRRWTHKKRALTVIPGLQKEKTGKREKMLGGEQ